MSSTVKMNVESNLGYAPDQVDGKITLADLLAQVEQAIEEWGEDAEVVLHQTNNRYGANYGRLARWDDLFTADRHVFHCSHCGEHVEPEQGEDWVECGECGFDLDVATLEPVVA